MEKTLFEILNPDAVIKSIEKNQEIIDSLKMPELETELELNECEMCGQKTMSDLVCYVDKGLDVCEDCDTKLSNDGISTCESCGSLSDTIDNECICDNCRGETAHIIQLHKDVEKL